MTKAKSSKQALLKSGLALLMCISMLIGSTFAWFTDSVTSAGNKIQSGNLKVDLELLDKQSGEWYSIKENRDPIFNYDKWEPGYTDVKILKVKNEGNLALKWYAKFVSTAKLSALGDVIDVYVFSTEEKLNYPDDRGLQGYIKVGTLNEFANTPTEFIGGSLLADKESYFGIALKMQESAGNDYQNMSLGLFDIMILATQEQYESDSFGSDYDVNALFPYFDGGFRAEADVSGKVDENNQLSEDVLIGSLAGRMHAIVPKGTALNPNTNKLILYVKTTDRSGNIEMTRGQLSRSLDVHIEGIAENNTVPITIDLGVIMPKNLKGSSIEIYHVENNTPVQMTSVDILTAHNEFVYKADSGEMAVNMATFSEVTALVAAGDPWSGERDIAWYNTTDTVFTLTTEEQLAGFAAIVGGMAENISQDGFKGKTVKLGADMNLGGLNGKVWYPIGYYNNLKTYERQAGEAGVTSDLSSFEGFFDGDGHTITDIYQNTWEMFGDYNSGYSGTPNYYKDGMGLFGFVLGGMVKNLTINNFQSDGEFGTTGCVTAYAAGSCTFENINITNSNPRAYNVPNGGVVGYAYDGADNGNVINFNNIKVDASNKITALWGSYDVGCGGILGRVNGDTTINMTNCVSAAIIDVYNDVCGNYQYYQYRYSGTLIGTVGPDTDPTTGPEKVNFENVKVYVGNWADYYFCEFEKNSPGSYTEDFQFSRVEKGDINIDPQTNLPYKENLRPCQHVHTEREDKMGLYLPFNQLYTGYSWGAKAVKEAPGVTVIHHFYTVTYKNADGSEVLAVDYVTEGERSETKLWANAYTIKSGAITDNGNKIFKGWVNSDSVKTISIDAGNRNDVVLYESWENPFTARFVDKDGNVIYSEYFTESDRTLSFIPDVPKVEGYVGEWQEYRTLLQNATSDITIHPIYILKEYEDENKHESVTEGLTAAKLFEYLADGQSVVLGENLTADGKSLNISGGKNGLCEITTTTSRLNLNTYELTCDFSHSANKQWYVFELAQNSKLTVTGGVNGEGTLCMNLEKMNGGASAYVFALQPGSTLVLEAGVTIEVHYPTANNGKVFAFKIGDKVEDFADNENIYVDKSTDGVLRIIVGVTTTITAPAN